MLACFPLPEQSSDRPGVSLLLFTLHICLNHLPPAPFLHLPSPSPPKFCTGTSQRLLQHRIKTSAQSRLKECILRRGKLGGITSAQGQESTSANSSEILKMMKMIKIFLSLEARRPSVFLEQVIKRLFAFMLPITSSSLKFSADQVNIPCMTLIPSTSAKV